MKWYSGETIQLVKSLDSRSKDCGFKLHCWRGVVLVWASHSKLLAWPWNTVTFTNVTRKMSFGNRSGVTFSQKPVIFERNKHHDKNNEGLNQWIVRVKITPRLLNSYLPFSSRAAEFWRVTCKQMAYVDWPFHIPRSPVQSSSWCFTPNHQVVIMVYDMLRCVIIMWYKIIWYDMIIWL